VHIRHRETQIMDLDLCDYRELLKGTSGETIGESVKMLGQTTMAGSSKRPETASDMTWRSVIIDRRTRVAQL
jgi:hypothetical protein